MLRRLRYLLSAGVTFIFSLHTMSSSPQPVPTEEMTKLLLLDFRDGISTADHPDLLQHLEQGWRIRSASPRVVEQEGTKLFVVLSRGDAPAS